MQGQHSSQNRPFGTIARWLGVLFVIAPLTGDAILRALSASRDVPYDNWWALVLAGVLLCMVTSTSHRSPATPEWEQVRELYQRPNPSPGEIVSRIVAALDEAARVRLADAAAVRCLDAVVHSSAAAATGAPVAWAEPGCGLPALDWAAQVRGQAQDSILRAGAASTLGAIALDAVAPTVLDALGPSRWPDLTRSTVLRDWGGFARERALRALAGQYLAHDFERIFRYFVARDISDFVGNSVLPTVGAAARVVDQVGELCRRLGSVPLCRGREDELQNLTRLPREQRVRELAPLLLQAVQIGLGSLSGGNRE